MDSLQLLLLVFSLCLMEQIIYNPASHFGRKIIFAFNKWLSKIYATEQNTSKSKQYVFT